MNPPRLKSRWRKESLWGIALTALFAAAAHAQSSLLISGFELDAAGNAHFKVPRAEGYYYILYRGETVSRIRGPADVEQQASAAEPGSLELVDDRAPFQPLTRFYRIEQVSLQAPKDLDGDGLPDPYELARWPGLDPLNPFDAAQDPDHDGASSLAEFKRGTSPFSPNLPPASPTFIAPPASTQNTFIQLSGRAPIDTYLRIEGGAAVVTNSLSPDGTFVATIPLQINRVNRLFVSSLNAQGEISAGQPLEVLQDSQPPILFVDFPTNGMVQTVNQMLVAGRVGDGLSGYQGLRVWVHSAPSEGEVPLASTQFPDSSPLRAVVDVGIGANGTYERSGVPLANGLNTLTVIASDALGNRTLRRTLVTGNPLQGSRLVAISGDGQGTNVLHRLAAPLVLRASKADGTVIANAVLEAEVTRSNGRLLPVDNAQAVLDWRTHPSANTNGAMKVTLRTDASGTARLWWTLGSDAGCANNRVTVSSASFSNAVYFCATATALPAGQINIGSGNQQTVETGALALEPLRAWVSDGLNPVANVPVTFRIARGEGRLLPGGRDGVAVLPPGGIGAAGTTELTVLTGITGHASVQFAAGAVAEQNLVSATIPSHFGRPATFRLTSLARHTDQPGNFSGIVLDNTGNPIIGAYCELTVANFRLGQLSDAQGRFHFQEVPGGMGHLFVNGSVATGIATNRIPTNSFPALSYSVVAVANASNSLPTPVLLPRLNPANARVYRGTNDLVLTCAGMEGLKMTIRANSMSFPDGTRVTPERPAVVSLDQVHHDDIPMPMPDGVAPAFAWTLQPGGSHFRPETPVEIEYPNMSGLAPGSIAYFLSFNHDTERFEIVASGHVTTDGAQIVTDPASGLTISGWGCNCPPYSASGSCQSSATPCVPPTPSANGCGAAAMGGGNRLTNCDLLPGIPPIKYCFTSSCDDHDICYGTCGNPKAQCDLAFLNSMLQTCDAYAGNNPVNYGLCATRAYALYEMVTIFGGPLAYQPAQAAACVCEDPERPNTFGRYSTPRRVVTPLAPGPTPVFVDADGDALPDDWERAYGLDPTDPTDFYQDPDGDGLSNFVELMLGFNPLLADSDGDGVNDLAEATQISPPLNRPGRLDENWVLQVAGQSTEGDLLGHFSIENITVADVTGEQPGSGPDFYGDDLVRLTGVSTSSAGNRYASSGFFRIRQGAVTAAPDIVITNVPPRIPESLVVRFPTNIISQLAGTLQAQVVATYADGTQEELNSAAVGTTFRVSNPAVLSVDGNGRVTATGLGHAFVTASNQGATATAAMDVVPGGSSTATVRGQVRHADGTPAAGVTVTLTGLSTAAVATGGDGGFTLPGASTAFGGINIVARVAGPNGRLVAIATGLDGSSGTVDAGILTLAPVAPAPRFVAGGAYHGLSLKRDGTLWAWGDNPDGQVGDGTRNPRTVPVQIGASTEWKSITAGERHSHGLRTDGTLWGWGYNGENQLGDGTKTTRTAPRQIGTAADWAWVEAGANHTLALKKDGSLWGWGGNEFSQLARENQPSIAEPTELVPGTRWRSISGGRWHSLGVKTDGTLWGWGSNSNFELADSVASRATPTQIGTDSDWEQATAGGFSSFGIKTDGSVSCWGLNTLAQLGLGDIGNRPFVERMKGHSDWWYISCAGSHTIGLKLDGTAWGWGENGAGIVADLPTARVISPLQVSSNKIWQAVIAPNQGGFTVGVDRAGALWTWGLNEVGQLGDGRVGGNRQVPTRVVGGLFQQVAAGSSRSAAVTADGRIASWGRAAIGDGTFSPMDFPLVLSGLKNGVSLSAADFTQVVLQDGTLWGWGNNFQGELAIGSASFSELIPVKSGTRKDWREVVSAFSHGAGIALDGSCWTWGNNSAGQLGNNSTEPSLTPVRVNGLPGAVRQAAVGDAFTMVLAVDGSLWAWGDNAEGPLGDESNIGRLIPARVGGDSDWTWITANGSQVLATKADGSLWGWGHNAENQLGDGTRFARLVPTRIPSLTNVRRVSAGYFHSAALLADGSLWAWGRNSSGQLGDGTTVNRSTPVRIGTDTDWVSLSLGVSHTLAIKQDGSLWAWGDDDQGALGVSSRSLIGNDGWGLNAPLSRSLQAEWKASGR